MKSYLYYLQIIFISVFILPETIFGQQNDSDLAKASQNPVADMYSLPFQNNTIYGNDPHNRPQNILNIQPVIPVNLTGKLNLINRLIAPVITQPSSVEDASSTGMGDLSLTAWLSPAEAKKIIYGIGPVFQIPVASEPEFGSGEFGIGPSVVALTIIDRWVAGIVVNNVWTFGSVKENKFLFQYFVNYNLPKAWYVVSGPIMTANWNADLKQRWVVPVGAGVGKVFRIGKLPVNINGQVFKNVIKPDGVGDWQSRIQLQFIFPKA